ncbi:MAG TPA: class I SAM-dependent methyltransferase [Planctomycetota bacterium]|nr:class I SAM-dependent methyltransferase [Planctomycetota bacterium]
MSFADERLVPEEAVEASLQEHVARYRFARERIRGRVLDVACGTGYGTSMLGALGADRSLEALRYARRYPAAYLAADAARLPFGRVFDSVVSFETIEHLPDPGGFVAECARVLKPGGLFLVSTPNRELWSPRSPTPLQRHHVREFNRREFLEVLQPFHVQLFGQVVLSRRGAALWEGKELAKRVLRAFLPIRRFRPAALRRLDGLEPDPRYAVVPVGRRTPAIFVAVATIGPPACDSQ